MYGHLVPGKISENLRKALGLRRYDLPPYVYRMRVLGYPPGWIKEAEEETSDLCMFDIDGKNVGNQKRKKGFINSEKIVEYPGFNVPMEKGAHDVGLLVLNKKKTPFLLLNILSRNINTMVFRLFLAVTTNK